MYVQQLSGPKDFKHLTHVDIDFNWQGDPTEVIELTKKIGEGFDLFL